MPLDDLANAFSGLTRGNKLAAVKLRLTLCHRAAKRFLRLDEVQAATHHFVVAVERPGAHFVGNARFRGLVELQHMNRVYCQGGDLVQIVGVSPEPRVRVEMDMPRVSPLGNREARARVGLGMGQLAPGASNVEGHDIAKTGNPPVWALADSPAGAISPRGGTS